MNFSINKIRDFLGEVEAVSTETPYQLYEKIAPAEVVQATYVCAVPLRLDRDLANNLIGRFVGANDKTSNILESLMNAPFIIPSSGATWRYDRLARQYFLRQVESNAEYARPIHGYLLEHYQKSVNGFSSQVKCAYHTIPIDPEAGNEKYKQLFLNSFYTNNLEQQEVIENLVEQQRERWLRGYAQELAFYRAMYQYRKANYLQAQRTFSEIVAKYEVANEYIGIAYHLLGWINWNINYSLIDAEEQLRTALQMHQELGIRRGEAQVRHTLGRFLQISNPSEAEEQLRTALQILQELGDRHGEAQVRHTLGRFLQTTNPPETEEQLRTSLQILQELGDRRGEAQVRHTLGRFLQTSNPPEAGEQVGISFQILRELGDRDSEVKVWQTYTRIIKEKELEDALEMSQGFLKIVADYIEGQLQHAKILKELERYPEALVHIQNVIGKNPEHAKAHNDYADTLKLMGKDYYTQAENYYRTAIRLHDKDDDLYAAMFRHNLAMLLSEIPEQHVEALDWWLKAIDANPNFVWSYVELGLFFYRVAKDIKTSTEYLIEGITHARSRGVKEAATKATEALRAIWEETRDPTAEKAILQVEGAKFAKRERVLRSRIASYHGHDIQAAKSRHYLAQLLSTITDRASEAVELWKEAIEIFPRFVWSWINLGEFIYMSGDDLEEAIGYLLTGLSIAEEEGLTYAITKAKEILQKIYHDPHHPKLMGKFGEDTK